MSIRVELIRTMSSEQQLRFILSEALLGDNTLALNFYSKYVPKSSDYKSLREIRVMTNRETGSWNIEIEAKQWIVYDGLNKRYMSSTEYVSWIDKRVYDSMKKVQRYLQLLQSEYGISAKDLSK